MRIRVTLLTGAAGVLAAACLIATGCGSPCTSCGPATVLDVSPAEAYDLVQTQAGNPDFVILDVRTPSEYAAEHIENAINIDFYAADFETQVGALDKTNIYLVYCQSGNRSGQAAAVMDSLGFEEIYNLTGGISAWIAAGYPTVN